MTIVHASVGSGHKAAANAIAQAFDLIRGTNGIPEDVEIEVLDILDFGRIKFDGNKTAASFTGATRPIYDLTWRYTLTGHLLWGGGTTWSRIMFPAFNEYIRSRRPIAVVATHITAANVAVGARVITGIDYPVTCVPTDYEVEGWWPHKDTDLFCVANEFMAETLRPRRIRHGLQSRGRASQVQPPHRQDRRAGNGRCQLASALRPLSRGDGPHTPLPTQF